MPIVSSSAVNVCSFTRLALEPRTSVLSPCSSFRSRPGEETSSVYSAPGIRSSTSSTVPKSARKRRAILVRHAGQQLRRNALAADPQPSHPERQPASASLARSGGVLFDKDSAAYGTFHPALKLQIHNIQTDVRPRPAHRSSHCSELRHPTLNKTTILLNGVHADRKPGNPEQPPRPILRCR